MQGVTAQPKFTHRLIFFLNVTGCQDGLPSSGVKSHEAEPRRCHFLPLRLHFSESPLALNSTDRAITTCLSLVISFSHRDNSRRCSF